MRNGREIRPFALSARRLFDLDLGEQIGTEVGYGGAEQFALRVGLRFFSCPLGDCVTEAQKPGIGEEILNLSAADRVLRFLPELRFQQIRVMAQEHFPYRRGAEQEMVEFLRE